MDIQGQCAWLQVLVWVLVVGFSWVEVLVGLGWVLGFGGFWVLGC